MLDTPTPLVRDLHEKHQAARGRILKAGLDRAAAKKAAKAERSAKQARLARQEKVERMKTWVPPKRELWTMTPLEQAVQKALDGAQPTMPQAAMRGILDTTCKAFGVRIAEVLSDRHDPAVVVPRHAAMWLCKKLTTASLPMIGKVFGRDHTTIMAAVKSTNKRMDRDPAIRDKIVALQAFIGRQVGFEC